jgi:pyruvate formate lyase activating enzyme
MAFDGYEIDSTDIVKEVLKDRTFYEASGGGATLSGGDPLSQAVFSRRILGGLREEGIHTAMETCLAAEWGDVEPFLPLVDLFLVDLKVVDGAEHMRWTGGGNESTLSNLECLAERGADVRIRVPLVPGATATDANLASLGGLIRRIAGGLPVELMNFNPLARGKYEQRGQSTPFDEARAFTAEDMAHFRGLLEAEGVRLWQEEDE